MSGYLLSINLLLECLSRYGYKTISIYYRLKLLRSQTIRLPGISKPIHIRPNTSDPSALQQMFISAEYEISIDFLPSSIIDAGANIGLAAVYFANLYTDATIISIEPDASNYEMLVKNTKEYPQVVGINKAISNKVEELDIVDNNYGKWGMMTERSTGTEKSVPNTITIPKLITEYNLDTLDIVKIDIEGFEKELFESNYEIWLPKTRCLIVELHDRLKPGCSKSVFSALSKYDFSLSLKGENLVFINNAL